MVIKADVGTDLTEYTCCFDRWCGVDENPSATEDVLV